MKKVVIAIIALILVIICLFGYIIYIQFTNQNWNKVEISIKENSLTYTGATFIVKNRNLIATSYLIDDYSIYKRDGYNWVKLPKIESDCMHLEVAIVENPRILYTYEEYINWEDQYGVLDSGTYRVDFEFRDNNKNVDTNVTISVEFALQ